jgi:hypothetical protein
MDPSHRTHARRAVGWDGFDSIRFDSIRFDSIRGAQGLRRRGLDLRPQYLPSRPAGGTHSLGQRRAGSAVGAARALSAAGWETLYGACRAVFRTACFVNWSGIGSRCCCDCACRRRCRCDYLSLFAIVRIMFRLFRAPAADSLRRPPSQRGAETHHHRQVGPGLIVQLSTALLGQSVRVWFP